MNLQLSKDFWSQGPDEIEHAGAIGGGWNHHLSFLAASTLKLRLKLCGPSLSDRFRLPRDSNIPYLRNIPSIRLGILLEFKVYSSIKGYWSLWVDMEAPLSKSIGSGDHELAT